MEKPRAASFKRRKCFARPRGWERLRRQGSKSIILELRVAGTSMPRTTDFVVIAALAIGVLGCGGVASREPSKGIDVTRFGGRWALDRQASEDVRARLVPLFERNERQWRRNAERFEEPAPRESDGRGGTPDEGISTMHWLQGERRKEIQSVIAFVTPATQLDIQASANRVQFVNNKGEGTRTLIPGESIALFVELGGFKVTSGWKDSAFIIDLHGEGENRVRIIEQYRLAAEGTQLEERLEVQIPTISKQVFHIVYRRS